MSLALLSTAIIIVILFARAMTKRRRADRLTWTAKLSRREQSAICLRYFQRVGMDVRPAPENLASVGFSLELRANNRRTLIAFLEAEHPVTATFCRDLADTKLKAGGVFDIIVVAHPKEAGDLAVVSTQYNSTIIRPQNFPELCARLKLKPGPSINKKASPEPPPARLWKPFEQRIQFKGVEYGQEETANYWLDFIAGNDTLFVTLESMGLPQVQGDPMRLAWGARPLTGRGVSVLGIKPKQNCWYRRPDLMDFLHRLKATGFFDGYRRVVFYGSSMGGYGALMLGSLVENSIIVALNPQTTLNSLLAPWEMRFNVGRGEEWTGVDSDAAVSAASAKEVWVCYDPLFRLDRLHIERMSTHNLRELKVPGVGHEVPAHLLQMGMLKMLTDGIVKGDLDSAAFHALARNRRDYGLYWARLGMRLKHDKTRAAFLARAQALMPDHADVKLLAEFPSSVTRYECATCSKSWSFDIPRQIGLFGDLNPSSWLNKLQQNCQTANCAVERRLPA